ncbi:MAG: cytochrome ubiquinol oxidase subunit I, partial [Burkholderiaceae bacterium]
LANGRETLGSTMLDAVPNVILHMPGDSLTPLFTALAMAFGFVGLLLHSWVMAAGGLLALGTVLTVWLWPVKRSAHEQGGHGE